MNKSYVQQYAGLETSHWWFLVRKKIILQSIKKGIKGNSTHPIRILNIGAAAGASTKWLSEIGEVTSVEYDPLFLEYLTNTGISAIHASVTQLPFPNESFDLVCAFDVIEHVENDQHALEEMFRVCKENGNVCLTVPAFSFLWSAHDEVNHHFRRYTLSQFRKLLINIPAAKEKYSTYFNTLLFLPVAIIRLGQQLFKKPTQRESSDFDLFEDHKIINGILKNIFAIEILLLRMIRLPFGISLLLLSQKNTPTTK